MKNGVLNVSKEKGYTSHDVVAKLRGITHQKKIGHTGTLEDVYKRQAEEWGRRVSV